MRIYSITLILLITVGNSVAVTLAQEVNIVRKGASFEQLIKSIEKQTKFSFFYKKEDVVKAKNISVEFKNTPFLDALEEVSEKSGLSFEIFDNTVVFKKKPEVSAVRKTITHVPTPTQSAQEYIHGKVVDEHGSPIQGVSVFLERDPKLGVQTNKEGDFNLPASSDGEAVVFRFIGYETKTIKVSLQDSPYRIVLESVMQDVEEVVITGMMERKKDSFTGATASFTGEELKMISNKSVIHSLRSVDPSFIFIENNALGSNPNGLPTIELRGQSSISIETLQDEFSTDPNQPLFILDGFETSLREIVDLDMNIVESVTILKDAASTAIYGSRASNGVVVVETIKPKEGKVTLTYSTDLGAEIADLTSYNMMDAREKLEFERLAGRYISNNAGSDSYQLDLDDLYNERRKEVERGVNTYWLSQPLQTGFSNRHSLSARGGQGAIQFDIGANYKNIRGAMKESGRENWGANVNINYRTGKINFSNRAYVSGSTGNNSPYGKYSDWVNANPYLRILPSDEPYLAEAPSRSAGYLLRIANPFYNAALNSFDRSNNYTVTNNLQMKVDFSKQWRFQASGQLSKEITKGKEFVSALHTDFAGTENNKKGSYTESNAERFEYTVNAMLTYAEVIGKHSITSNARVEFRERQNHRSEFMAVGFPPAANGNPIFAFSYPEGGKPSAATKVSRANSFILSGNYSYDHRYNADLSMNFDGTNAFGTNRKYQPYYAAGLSWNADREEFLKNVNWLSMLRLRTNYGLTGNQNFSNVNQSIFSYYQDVNRFGQGIYLSALGAPNLEWQKTQQLSTGLDLALWNNGVSLTLNAYKNYTSPLVVAVTLPASTGLRNYPFNAGALTVKGLEYALNVSPINRPQEQVMLTFGVMGNFMKQRYSNFSNVLEALNKELRESNSLVRYRDGADPRDMWAVPSLGIDPGTGQEVFLKKDGQYTYKYSSDDQVIVGNSQPISEGAFNGSFSYKGFTAGVIVRFIWQKDIMNGALYNKVENISLAGVENNQDRRALYERWKQEGDNAKFKAINLNRSTPMSSRFLQTESTLSGESISLGYQLRNKVWLDQVGISTLRFTGYLNEIFHASTIQRERGIDYPFARSISFSLTANFK